MQNLEKLKNIKGQKSKFSARGEKGSITLFVLIAMLFFIVVLVSLFVSNNNNLQTQMAEIEKIKENYNFTDEDLGSMYSQMTSETPIEMKIYLKDGTLYSKGNWASLDNASSIRLEVEFPEGSTDRKIKIGSNPYETSGQSENKVIIEGIKLTESTRITGRCNVENLRIMKFIDVKVDPLVPDVTITPENNHTPNASVNVSDKDSGIDENATFSYLWTTRESGRVYTSGDGNVTKLIIDKDDFTGKLSGTVQNGGTVTIPDGISYSGKYWLYILARDKAGNEVISKSNPFTIGNISPEASYTYGELESIKQTTTLSVKAVSPTVVYDSGKEITTGRDWYGPDIDSVVGSKQDYWYVNKMLKIKAEVKPIKPSSVYANTTLGVKYTTTKQGVPNNVWKQLSTTVDAGNVTGNYSSISGELPFNEDLHHQKIYPHIFINTRETNLYEVEYKDIEYLLDNPDNIAEITVNGEKLSSSTSGYEEIVKTWNYTFQKNGTYNIVVKDIYGNSISTQKEITNIDHRAPDVTFGTNGNSSPSKSASTVVTVVDNTDSFNKASGVRSPIKYLWTTRNNSITDSDFVGKLSGTLTSGETISAPESYSGKYYLYILAYDNVGNKTIAKSNAFTIGNIEPEIEVQQSSDVPIQGNIDLTIKATSPTIVFDSGLQNLNQRNWQGPVIDDVIGTKDDNWYVNKVMRLKADVKVNKKVDPVEGREPEETTMGIQFVASKNGETYDKWQYIDQTLNAGAVTSSDVHMQGEIVIAPDKHHKQIRPHLFIHTDDYWYNVDYKNIEYQLLNPDNITSVKINGKEVSPTITVDGPEGTNTGEIRKTYNFHATEEGTCIIEATDIYGNVTTKEVKVNIDRTRPQLESITANKTSPTNAQSIEYTFRFSEDVKDFNENDIKVVNGQKGAFKANNAKEYTLTVTNDKSCTQSVSVDNNVCTDMAGNNNIGHEGISILIDRDAPTVNVSPSTVSYEKTVKVTISAKDTGGSELSSSNIYQYQLGTSSTSVPSSTWNSYNASGSEVTLGTNITGTRYLWVKQIADKAGNISSTNGSKQNNYHVFGPYYFDNTAPTISVSITGSNTNSTSSTTYTKTKTVKITVSDTGGSGLSSSNSYQYYVGSSTPSSSTTWSTYAASSSGSSYIIGDNLTGSNYYLWIKEIKDSAGNVSTSGGTKSSTYHKFGPYYFDNTAPTSNNFTISINENSTSPLSITNASVTDSNSGISKYEYKYKKVSESSWSVLSTVSTSSSTCTTTLSLTSGYAYNICLVVYDKAGNTKQSTNNLLVFRVNSESSLKELATYTNNSSNNTTGMYAYVTQDFSMSSTTSFTPIGSSTSKFKGTFDGNNYKISGLYISGTSNFRGLFGYTDYATIKEVNLKDANINGGSYVGGIIGEKYYGTIENCSIVNSSIYGSGYRVGGIVGYHYYGTTQKCDIDKSKIRAGSGYLGGIVGHSCGGTVSECYNTGYYVGSSSGYIGGITGYTTSSPTVDKCYNRSFVKGSSYVGGIVGYLESGPVRYSYNAGTVNGNSNFGAIAGYSGGIIANGFYLDASCPNATGVLGISRTEEQMKSGDMISSLGGSSYWKQDTLINEGFPILKNNLQDRGIYDTTQTGSYYFNVSNDTLRPNNIGVNSQVAHNYLKIDLTNVDSSASYKIIVNASISSELNHDYGYATINNSTAAPGYNIETGQFMKISGQQTGEYTTYITGGSTYYLHLCYYKDGSNSGFNSTASNENFTINSITTVCGENIEYASEDTDYIGYYADLDGDGTADGIIYADLAVGSNGTQKWNYQYDKVTSGLKKYTVSEEDGRGFGKITQKMIKVAQGTGGTTDRFYVMALEDVSSRTYYWYKSGNFSDINIANSTGNFGDGIKNTNWWISNYGNYGATNQSDMWNVIQANGSLTKYGKTWFVPSVAEWSAFEAMCYRVSSNPGGLPLSRYYWTSTLNNTGKPRRLEFNVGFSFEPQDFLLNVRLSTTF